MTSPHDHPTILLIPGHWLGAWAWDEVSTHLVTQGRKAVSLTLPGLDPADPARSSRTLEEQAEAVLAALLAYQPAPVLVAHSGANAPVSLVLDRSPAAVGRVIWVDSGPVAPGTVFAPQYPEDAGPLPLPSFDALGQQASLAGLDELALQRFRDLAVAEPAAVLRTPVALSNPARFDVPSTFVCSSLPSKQLLELAAAHHPMFAETLNYRETDFVDLPTGHWPMWSRAADLARIIDERSR